MITIKCNTLVFLTSLIDTIINEKSSQRRLHSGCSNAEPKIFAPLQTHFLGAQDGQNLISWRWSLPLRTTYKPSLVRIKARNFKLSW